jgi:hypothetical protein
MLIVNRKRAHATSGLKWSLLVSSFRSGITGTTGFDKHELSVVNEIDKSFLFNTGFVCPYFNSFHLRSILHWSLQLGVLRKSDQSLIN